MKIKWFREKSPIQKAQNNCIFIKIINNIKEFKLKLTKAMNLSQIIVKEIRMYDNKMHKAPKIKIQKNSRYL